MSKFLTSVANVYGYTQDDQLLFAGKTMLDSSIETSLSNTDVRAGQGNQLQYIFYHTAEFKSTITEAQFNLDFIALNTGGQVTVGAKMFLEESVTLSAGAGTVAGTPIVIDGAIVYGWVTFPDGGTERVVFTGKTFTTARTTSDELVCVRFYNLDSSAKEVKINANMMPKTIKLVMETMLCSSDESTTKIGTVQIIIPKASLTGAFTLDMKPDAVSSTPLTIRALAYSETGGGCSGTEPLYARIVEKLFGTHWYDDVDALAVVGGDFVLGSTLTKQLQIKALPSVGSAFAPPLNELTFAGTGVTCSASGLVTGAVGGGTVLVSVTAKPTIEITIKVTAA